MYDFRSDNPRFDQGGAKGPKPKAGGSLIPLITVLGTLLLLVVGLIVLTGRAGILMVLVAAAILALPILHYITWGWWLSKSLSRDVSEDDTLGEADDSAKN